MPWQQLTLRLTAQELPRAEALLNLAGAQSVSIHDDGDTPLLEPAPGRTPVWPDIVLKALFAEDVNLAPIVALLDAEVAASGTAAELDVLSDADWIEAWRQRIEPLRIGDRLRILPAEDVPAALGDDELGLHMGLAFGTGQHPTTALCLRWLEAKMPPGIDVLDYGTGSGILALAALKLGARRAWAVDNDAQALTAIRENALLNGLTERIWIGPPAELPAGRVNVILANILARPLCELAAAFGRMQSEGGTIVLSGITVEQVDKVQATYARDYRNFQRSELNGWACLTAERSS